MKKNIIAGFLFLMVQCLNAQVNPKLQAYVKEISYNKQHQPSFIKLKDSPKVSEAEVSDFINSMILGGGINKVSVLKTDKDTYGFSTTRYGIVQNGFLLYNKVIIAHCKGGTLVSLNGDLVSYVKSDNQFSLSENQALGFALKKVNAKKYKWENKEEELSMRKVLNKPDFSYYPTGTKVGFVKDGKVKMAYEFTIYAEVPLYRANVLVDATSGNILCEQNLICNIDVPGSANTLYSGTRAITCDQTAPSSYRLREAQRGLGIETYNMNNTLNYVNTDFNNTSSNWTTTGFDQAAEDAHWGAESTYDFYYNKFNINSIDNAGYKLISYLHYDTNYDNAFWNGICMTYGDGDGTFFTIFTALDVCGHEITHGLVSNTAALGLGTGTDECDALNEGFADIFGTSIERYARPNNWNWIMGLDIDLNGQGLRNMSNPPALGQPNTYLGNNWDPNGEPHNNNGPCIYWFYLLTAGGSGTNDNGDSYNITGLGNVDAEKIAYRALTTYFTPGTTYDDARVAAIQAAKDLFGDCSNQVLQTANAWHAVGVGGLYSTSVIAAFSADNTSFCSLPAVVNFNNTTSNGSSYSWDFGDGSTSTGTNTSHSYQNTGSYTVKLKAVGCVNSVDSLVKTAYIVIDVPSTPSASGATICGAGQVVLSANGNDVLTWFSSPTSVVPLGTGSNFLTPTISASTTFYVVDMTNNGASYGGITSFQSGGILNNANESLIFDVLQNCVLNSVVVYANPAGNRTIELRDQFGNVMNSVLASLTVGSNTVTMNFPLTPGTNYELGLNSASTSDLFRTNSGVSFPYSVGGCVNITGSTAGNSFYYWFYNWKVTKQNCGSTPVAVTASIIPLPSISLSTGLLSDSICNTNAPVAITANPPGGSLIGSGLVNSSFDPSVSGPGTQSIFYTYTDVNGCTNTDSLSMEVSICTGIPSLSSNAGNLNVYPNPFTDRISIQSAYSGALAVSITDATGRLVFNKNLISGEDNVSLAGLSKGLYLMNVQEAGSGKILKTQKLVKE